MNITLRYFDGCPNWKTADERLHEALGATDVGAEVEHELVAYPEDAERLRFRGPPTLLIDGRGRTTTLRWGSLAACTRRQLSWTLSA